MAEIYVVAHSVMKVNPLLGCELVELSCASVGESAVHGFEGAA